MGITGETRWIVPSLSFPDPQSVPDVEELTSYESVRLFVERARATVSSFEVTKHNAPTVARLCRQLDGMPLALELAAARTRVLSVQQIAEKLEDSLGLLTGGSRTTTLRQRTLRGTLDWSHGLLDEPEQKLFRRLSAFAGGCDLEAAEAVGAGEGIEEGDVLDLISRLVDKSMVVAETRGETSPRYRLQEPIRQYARERLEGSAEADAILHRHALWFLALAERGEPGLRGEEQGVWIECLDTEHDNLRAALRWLLTRRDYEPALRLCGALGKFWQMHAYLSEGQRWLEEALKAESESASLRIKVLSNAALIAWERGEFQKSVLLSRETLALSRQTGDKLGAAFALYNLGYTAMFEEDHERAQVLFEEAMALQRETRDEVGLARSFQGLGLTFHARGEFGRAQELFEQGLVLARKTGDVQGIELLLLAMAGLALAQDQYGRVRELCAQASELLQRLAHTHLTAAILHLLASAAGSERQPVRAARLWGAAEALRQAIGVDLSPVETTFYARYIAAARSRLDEEAWAAAWAEGRAMPLQEAIEYALSTEEHASPRLAELESGETLTAREIEVLRLMSSGASNKDIAEELVLSVHTVKRHVANVLRTLGVPSRTHAAARARELGLI